MHRLLLYPITKIAFLALLGPTSDLTAQAGSLQPVSVGSQMPDFTLPVYQGGEVTLSQFRGKNVMLVFPRGKSRPGSWCHICPYQHSEFVEYEEQTNWRSRANLEIVYVLPYSRDVIEEWIDAYPQLLQDNEDGKNPPDQANLDDAGRARMERYRQIYPRVFSETVGNVPIPFPILVDGDHAISEGLGFFTTDWSGSTAEQNVPTILLIDAEGTLQFKYMSQNTIDRPPLEYMVQVIDIMNGMGG